MDKRWSEKVDMGDDKFELKIGLHDKSGALLMINKKERRLVKTLLAVTLKSPNTRRWIEEKLGKELGSRGKTAQVVGWPLRFIRLKKSWRSRIKEVRFSPFQEIIQINEIVFFQ